FYIRFTRTMTLFAILLCAVSVLAGHAYAEDLQSAVRTALTNHPSVEAALANQEAVKYERREMFAGYFPDLSLRAAGGRVFANNSTSRGTSTTRASAYSNLAEGGVTFTQPLFSGFETVNRVSAAAKRMESARFNVIDVRENLALRTTIAYLDV